MIGRTNSTTMGGGVTPDGATVTPINDVSVLLKCAGIKDRTYATMSELLAANDTDAMLDITMSDNAMQYLARSTGFADEVCANENFMAYLGQSPSVKDTVLNSDIWLSKLRQSPYWKQVANITVTIYGGASETITISGLYNSPTVTTNSDGSVNYSLIKGTYTFTGSVSGESFSRTVTSSTIAVYVMPEGALYWYGNEMTTFNTLTISTGLANLDGANSIVINSGTGNRPYVFITTTEKIDVSNFTCIKMITNVTTLPSNNFGIMIGYTTDTTVDQNGATSDCYKNGTYKAAQTLGNQTLSCDLGADTSYFIRCGQHYYKPMVATVYAIWLE